ncbi:MAG: SsrA-binding protein SmpB [Coriobacteriia bacterium]|nr:SsrA-binding protein SmpB [Coriobacteriia bacterium]
MAREIKTIAGNKKAYHDYFIDETFEAGIELTGTEVKSLRERGANLRESYASIKRGEVFLHGLHVPPYSHGNRANVDPDRVRRLLLHKREIRYLAGKTAERGFTLVPTKLYFNADNRAKIEIGLARGKKLYDKRASIAERDQKRDTERALRDRGR